MFFNKKKGSNMQIYFQVVSNIAAKINKKLKNYVLGLILTLGSKNCRSMARELFVRSKIYYDYLRLPHLVQDIIENRLKNLSQNIFLESKSTALIVDTTFIPKPFGRLLQNLGCHFDGVQKRVNKGLCLVVIAKSDGKSVVLRDFKFYIAKKSCQENYKTKIEIAKELIEEYYHEFNPDYICMDGGFMSESMIRFLKSMKAKYIMRIPCNRLVTINGSCTRLSEHRELRLIKNHRALTKPGYYKGIKCFFTIQKRKTRNGYKSVFLVSNIAVDAKSQLKLYSNRWPIEKSFRTIKQKLGLSDCRMITSSQQTIHILTVFFTFSFLETEKISKRKKSVDEILNLLRFKKDPSLLNQISELVAIYT